MDKQELKVPEFDSFVDKVFLISETVVNKVSIMTQTKQIKKQKIKVVSDRTKRYINRCVMKEKLN